MIPFGIPGNIHDTATTKIGFPSLIFFINQFSFGVLLFIAMRIDLPTPRSITNTKTLPAVKPSQHSRKALHQPNRKAPANWIMTPGKITLTTWSTLIINSAI